MKRIVDKRAIVLIFLSIISVIFVTIIKNRYNINNINSICTFTKDDIGKISIFDANGHAFFDKSGNPISLNYKISESDTLKISNTLVKSVKAKASTIEKSEDSVILMISLPPDRTIILSIKYDNSIYVELSKSRSIQKIFFIQSEWLYSYLKNIGKQFSS